MTDVADWFAEQDRIGAARTATVLGADPRSPDELADHAKIGAQLGLPPIVVGSDPAAYKARVEQKSLVDALAEAPKTAAWLSNRDNGGIAKDDVANLSWFEKGFKDWADSGDNGLSRAFARGTRSMYGTMQAAGAVQIAVDANSLGATLDQMQAASVAALGDNPTAEQIASAKTLSQMQFDILARLYEPDKAVMLADATKRMIAARKTLADAGEIPRSDVAQRGAGLWDSSPNTLMGKLGTFAQDPAAMIAFVGETAMESAPAFLPALAATAVTRNPFVGAAVIGSTSAYQTTASETVSFLDQRGMKLETPDDVLAVLSNKVLLKDAESYGSLKGIIIGSIDAMSGGLAGKELMASPIGDYVVQTIAQVVMGGGGEALAELAADGNLDWGNVLMEGLAEFATTPIKMVSVGRGWLKSSAEKATRANTTAGKIDQIDQLAAASKVKARSPEKMADFLDKVMDGKSLYVPADDLNQLFQAKDFGPADWGIDPATFEETLAAGGDIAVPVATYASKITGTDNADWFKENAKTVIGEMSAVEARRFNDEVRGIVDAQMASADADRMVMLEMRASDVQVKDQIYTMLRAAGNTKDVADTNARLTAAAIRTMAQRSGQDPLDMARRFGLEIKGPQTDQMRRRGNLDIALNTLRTGRMPKAGTSLMDFVIQAGGLQDVGGDLAAMDAPKGLISETRSQVMDRKSQPSLLGMPSVGKGKGLDDMARAAVEAGYFPDAVDEADMTAALIAALRDEMAGAKRYIPGQDGDVDLQNLAAELDRRGIDLAAGNDEIAAKLLDAVDGQMYAQSGEISTDSAAFKAWFGDSKVVDSDGKPLVVYHGSPDADLSSGEFSFEVGSQARSAEEASNAFYFSESKNTARDYAEGGDLGAFYAAIKNPLDLRYDEGIAELFSAMNPGNSYGVSRNDGGNFSRADDWIDDDGKDFNPLPSVADAVTFWDWAMNVSDGNANILINDIVLWADSWGYDGLIFVDGNRGDISTSYAAFAPSQIKSVNNRGTWDANDPRILLQQNRASIIFPSDGIESGTSVINLFENSDLSSFQHEIGHYMLEMFNVLASEESAPQDMRDDLGAIQRYLGMEAGAKPTVEQHETFARTWEAYLMEGKSPSLELSDAFARFKAWMLRIYQTVAGLKVKINPEIRGVLDRMIATDAEISAARDEQAMKPLFTDEVAAGMSPAAFKTYQRMARRATEQAEQSLMEKTMAVEQRKVDAWWKAEYKQVLDETTKAINSQRPYRLTEMLANQVWLSDTKRDVPDIQMDRKALVDTFGAGVLAELSREKLGGKRAIYRDGGASLMEVADLFGFANPQEMVETLQNAGKRKDAIRAETNRIMRDRYGDPLTDGSIESAALEAIHSEQQAMTVASEVRHLASRAGVPTRNLTAQVFRQRARLMLGRMAVSEVGNPNAFLAAGRKAAKRAEDAFARVVSGKDSKDALISATRHKEQQLLNHYLYLESRDFARELESGREKMRGYSKASVRQKLDGGYIEQIDALLDDYDFRVRGKGQIQRAENLTAFVQRMTDEGRAGELAIDPRVIARAAKVHYSRLSVDELRGLFDTIANIDHLGRFKKKLIDAQEQRDHDAVVDGVVAEFDANVKPNPPSRTPDAGERAAKRGRDYLNSILNADTLLREIDGFKDLGPSWTAMKAKIDQGMFRLAERRKAMGEAFDGIYSVYSLAEKRDMSMKRQSAALGIPMSKWDLISLALNTGNNDNFERLTNPKSPGHFDAASVQSALAELTERDWGVVQSTWDYINSFWPEIAAKEKRQTGVAPKKVEAKLMVDAPANVTGGYYPIRYDGRLSGLTQDFSQKELADSLMGGMFGKAQTRNGHVEARTSTTKQPVLLDLAVGHQHVEQVLYDLEIGEAVAGSWKILHDPRIRSAFINSGKQSDWDALEIWQQDVASGDRASAGGVQSMMRALRSGFTFSRLAFNVSTALIQPSGLVQSAVVIGKAAVAKGTIAYMQNPARWVREVTAVSSLMRERKLTFERDINNAVGDLALSQDGTSWVSKSANWISPVLGKATIGTSMRWQKFQRDILIPASFWMMQSVQFYAVDMPTWVSAYQKELAASKDETKARTYADTITKRAQGSGLISDRGMLERGTLNRNSRQQELPKLLTALGSYMFAKGNVAYEQAMKTDFKDPAQVMSFAVDIALLFTLEAVLYAAVKGGLPGEDEDEPADWAAWLAKQTLFSGMSTLPGFRELSGAMQGYGGGGVLGSSIEVIARPFTQAGQGEVDKAAVKAFVDAAGVMLHLPSAQTKNIIEGIFEADMSARKDPSIGTAILGGSGKGRSLADILFGD